MYYFLLMIFLVVFYLIGIKLFSKIEKGHKLINMVFPVIIFVFYLICVIKIYNDVGVSDWNFLNALPVANVSPFMYTLLFISLLFPKKIRYYVLTLVSLLSFAMFCAGMISCISYIARSYKFHFTIALDAFIHVALSMYGVYLVKSGQVDLKDKKKVVVSGGLIIGVALLMLIINLIFETSFFGLSMYGDHSIYNVVLFDSGAVSAIVYFIGLCSLLYAGYYFQFLLNKKV